MQRGRGIGREGGEERGRGGEGEEGIILPAEGSEGA